MLSGASLEICVRSPDKRSCSSSKKAAFPTPLFSHWTGVNYRPALRRTGTREPDHNETGGNARFADSTAAIDNTAGIDHTPGADTRHCSIHAHTTQHVDVCVYGRSALRAGVATKPNAENAATTAKK